MNRDERSPPTGIGSFRLSAYRVKSIKRMKITTLTFLPKIFLPIFSYFQQYKKSSNRRNKFPSEILSYHTQLKQLPAKYKKCVQVQNVPAKFWFYTVSQNTGGAAVKYELITQCGSSCREMVNYHTMSVVLQWNGNLLHYVGWVAVKWQLIKPCGLYCSGMVTYHTTWVELLWNGNLSNHVGCTAAKW